MPKKPAAISSGVSNHLAPPALAPPAVSASTWMISVFCSAAWVDLAGLSEHVPQDLSQDRTLNHPWTSISSMRCVAFRPRSRLSGPSNARLAMAMGYNGEASRPRAPNATVRGANPSLRGRYSIARHVRAAWAADNCLGSPAKPAAAVDV